MNEGNVACDPWRGAPRDQQSLLAAVGHGPDSLFGRQNFRTPPRIVDPENNTGGSSLDFAFKQHVRNLLSSRCGRVAVPIRVRL
jgi:hypothetical protein